MLGTGHVFFYILEVKMSRLYLTYVDYKSIKLKADDQGHNVLFR